MATTIDTQTLQDTPSGEVIPGNEPPFLVYRSKEGNVRYYRNRNLSRARALQQLNKQRKVYKGDIYHIDRLLKQAFGDKADHAWEYSSYTSFEGDEYEVTSVRVTRSLDESDVYNIRYVRDVFNSDDEGWLTDSEDSDIVWVQPCIIKAQWNYKQNVLLLDEECKNEKLTLLRYFRRRPTVVDREMWNVALKY